MPCHSPAATNPPGPALIAVRWLQPAWLLLPDCLLRRPQLVKKVAHQPKRPGKTR